jgi:hypothetical protein
MASHHDLILPSRSSSTVQTKVHSTRHTIRIVTRYLPDITDSIHEHQTSKPLLEANISWNDGTKTTPMNSHA